MSVVILRFTDMERILKMHRNSIYLKLNKASKFHDPSFPKPLKLSSNTVGFIESEVNAWLEKKMMERNNADC